MKPLPQEALNELKKRMFHIEGLFHKIQYFRDPCHLLFLWKMCQRTLIYIGSMKQACSDLNQEQVERAQTEQKRLEIQNTILVDKIMAIDGDKNRTELDKQFRRIYKKNIKYNMIIIQMGYPSELHMLDKHIRRLDIIIDECEKRIEDTGNDRMKNLIK